MLRTVTIGPLTLSTFTMLIGLAALLGLAVLVRQASPYGRSPSRWVDGGLVALAGGIVGGRLAFVALNWPYFAGHMPETWRVWLGGLSPYGALAGGLLALAIWARWRGERLGLVLDVLAPVIVLSAALIWLACLLHGCAYGQEVRVSAGIERWFVAELPDQYGVVNLRYATQLFGALWAALCAIIVLRPFASLPTGGRFFLVLVLYSAGSFVVNSTRGDAVPIVLGWRIDQMLDAILIIVGIVGLYWRAKVG